MSLCELVGRLETEYRSAWRDIGKGLAGDNGETVRREWKQLAGIMKEVRDREQEMPRLRPPQVRALETEISQSDRFDSMIAEVRGKTGSTFRALQDLEQRALGLLLERDRLVQQIQALDEKGQKLGEWAASGLKVTASLRRVSG